MGLTSINVKTKSQSEFTDITGEVEAAVRESKVISGTALVYCPHTTAGITINENADPAVTSDIEKKMAKLIARRDPDFTHMEGNSDGHIKSSLFGASETLIIEGGALVLGTWQSVYFAEFDGPRSRKVFVKIIAG